MYIKVEDNMKIKWNASIWWLVVVDQSRSSNKKADFHHQYSQWFIESELGNQK